MKPFIVGYRLVTQKVLDITPLKDWRGRWFKNKIVEAKDHIKAVDMVRKAGRFGYQALLIDRLPKNRRDKVRVIKIYPEIGN